VGETSTLVQDEAVEGAEGEDLGVPVVDSDAVGLGELAGREAFHASSVGVLVFLVMVGRYELLDDTGANSRQCHAFQEIGT
jgi:hypothetical protein